MKIRRIEGPTPNGGAYSVIVYLNIDFQPVEEIEATHAEITEYDQNGLVILRTYAELQPLRPFQEEL